MTRLDAGLVVQAALVLLVGHAALYALGLVRLRLGDVRLLGLSYLVGWALLGSVLSLTLIVGLDPSVVTVVLVSGVLVAGCAAIGRRSARVSMSAAGGDRSPLALTAAAIGAAIVAIAAAAAVANSLEGDYTSYWDSVAFWIPKAESIYYAHGLDAGVLGLLQHPEYPPLLPTMHAATFHFAGGTHPSLLPLQHALLGIAFLLAAFALLDRFAPRWVSLPALALLATTPWFWWRLEAPLGDQPLAYLIAVAALACVIWLYEPRGAWIGLAVVLLAAATLTKLEGGFLAGLLIAVVLVTGFAVHGRAALPALALLAAPAVIVPWRLWLGHHGLPTSAADYHPTDLLDPGFLSARTGRLAGALHWILGAPFDQLETAAMVCISAALLVVVAYRLPAITAAVAVWLALSCLGLATIYWIGRLELDWYLGTSASRVGTTVIIAAATLAPLLLGMALQRAAREPPA